jgi:hypothetical protein
MQSEAIGSHLGAQLGEVPLERCHADQASNLRVHRGPLGQQ